MADISKDIIPAKKRRTEASIDLCDKVLQLEQDLCCNLDSLKFSTPVTHVYNPLKYAKETHEDYMRKFCKVGQKVLFLGMNPGPFGMAQNGVSKKKKPHVHCVTSYLSKLDQRVWASLTFGRLCGGGRESLQ